MRGIGGNAIIGVDGCGCGILRVGQNKRQIFCYTVRHFGDL